MQKRQKEKKHDSLFRIGVTFILCGTVLLLSLVSVTTARYVMQWKPDPLVAKAKNFYFTSNILSSGDVPVYQLSNFVPGTGENSSKISFILKNYEDEFRISEADIDYSITATGLPDTDGTIIHNGSDGKTKLIQLSVPEECFSHGMAVIHVNVKSTSPYIQTLSADFELYKKISNVDCTVYDALGSNTVMLTITTGNSGGTVDIALPYGVLPDRTDSRLNITMPNVGTYICSINANANSQYSFTMFKNSPTSLFSINNFTVNGLITY